MISKRYERFYCALPCNSRTHSPPSIELPKLAFPLTDFSSPAYYYCLPRDGQPYYLVISVFYLSFSTLPLFGSTHALSEFKVRLYILALEARFFVNIAQVGALHESFVNKDNSLYFADLGSDSRKFNRRRTAFTEIKTRRIWSLNGILTNRYRISLLEPLRLKLP